MKERTPLYHPVTSDRSILFKTVFLALAALAVAGANSVEGSKAKEDSYAENGK